MTLPTIDHRLSFWLVWLSTKEKLSNYVWQQGSHCITFLVSVKECNHLGRRSLEWRASTLEVGCRCDSHLFVKQFQASNVITGTNRFILRFPDAPSLTNSCHVLESLPHIFISLWRLHAMHNIILYYICYIICVHMTGLCAIYCNILCYTYI